MIFKQSNCNLIAFININYYYKNIYYHSDIEIFLYEDNKQLINKLYKQCLTLFFNKINYNYVSL